jgi:hypothetical protein
MARALCAIAYGKENGFVSEQKGAWGVVLRIGILTGGGDAPGLNGIIESSVRVLREQGCEVVGIQDGFEGVFGKKRSL